MKGSLSICVMFLAITVYGLASCAPSNFNGESGPQKPASSKGKVHNDDAKPVDPSNDDQPPSISPDDLQALQDCGKKAGQNFANTAKFQVETADVDIGIGNRTQWQDTLAQSDKPRVLILTIKGRVANHPTIELGNPNTTYCLNLKVQIVNHFDLRVSKTARVIEVYDTQISNRATRTQI